MIYKYCIKKDTISLRAINTSDRIAQRCQYDPIHIFSDYRHFFPQKNAVLLKTSWMARRCPMKKIIFLIKKKEEQI